MRQLLERLERKCDEAAYPGNLGAVEMMRFYQIASKDEIAEMEKLLARGKNRAAVKLLQKVTGVKLASMKARWNPKAAYA